MKRTLTIGIGAIALAAIAGLFIIKHSDGPVPPRIGRSNEVSSVLTASERTVLDKHRIRLRTIAMAKPSEAIKELKAFVAEEQSNPSLFVRDQVTAARIRIGYLYAKQKDYDQAREELLEAEAEYGGTGVIDPNYGSLTDQAAYQAIVCLVASGHEEAAKVEFEQFLTERKHSPLIHAVYQRLRKMGTPQEIRYYESMVQRAISEQEALIEKESVMCGPKALAYLYEHMGLSKEDYTSIAKSCETNNYGTSLLAMQTHMQDRGLDAKGMRIKRDDFSRIDGPAIWLLGNHYVVFLSMDGNDVKVYDPLYKGIRTETVPNDARISSIFLLARPLLSEGGKS